MTILLFFKATLATLLATSTPFWRAGAYQENSRNYFRVVTYDDLLNVDVLGSLASISGLVLDGVLGDTKLRFKEAKSGLLGGSGNVALGQRMLNASAESLVDDNQCPIGR